MNYNWEGIEGLQSNIRSKKPILIISSALFLLGVYFGPSVLGGFAITEHSAIRYTFPNQDGELVFEKELEDKKIVFWDVGKATYVKLVENSLGILKRVTDVNSIDILAEDEKMKVNWSAHKVEDKGIYDVIFATTVLDKDIEKVIVSNEKNDSKSTPLSVVKEQSTVFIEMNVKDGYAAHYSKLQNEDVGSFSFRGLNSDGKVVSFD